MRIAICHQTFAAGDAIGNDILGMCRVLNACGHEPFVLCEANPHAINQYCISHDFSDQNVEASDLVIYHHSQAWKTGAEFITRAKGPIVFKFHNITPPQFFAPYANAYAEICRLGHELTHTLAKIGQPNRWLCDSAFNLDSVLSAGVPRENCYIAPPFNNVNSLLSFPNEAQTHDEIIRFLFVGRFAPNKGHLDLLAFCAAYRELFGSKFEMIIVGSIDPALNDYWQKFTKRSEALDLLGLVTVHSHVPDGHVHKLFRSAHVYITFSEHEGFCVPVIEAQAVGLPVVGSGATAIRETAGGGQFLGAPPHTSEDFLFYATLAHIAASNRQVRQTLVVNGQRNILSRFVDDVVENAFLAPLTPWLLPTL